MNIKDSIHINGLPLPTALVIAIADGIWQTPKDRDAWLSLFPENEIVDPLLYPLGEMRGQNSWSGITGPGYLGHTDEDILPGDIEQDRAILIADLGPERLIALDYRTSEAHPSVVALTSREHSCWRLIAKNIADFMKAIDLID